MDGVTLQSRIYAGYAKAATKAGVNYSVYRSVSPLNPIAPANKIATLPVLITSTQYFNAPNRYTVPTWFCYADGAQLKQFDLLVGPFGTFYIADMQPNLPIHAIRCNHTASLGSVVYSTSGPITESTPNYATGIPVYMQYKRETVGDKQAPDLGRAFTQWDAFIPLAEGLVHQDDVLTDESGVKYVIDAPDFLTIGYVSRLRLASV